MLMYPLDFPAAMITEILSHIDLLFYDSYILLLKEYPNQK
jgi:hypothetical protein